MKSSLRIALTGTLLMSAGLTLMNVNPAQAGTITHTYTTGGTYDDLDWARNFSIAKFNPYGGYHVLQSVIFSLNGELLGEVQYENRAATGRTVRTNLQGTVSLFDPTKPPADPSDPDSLPGSLISVIPLSIKTESLPRYDGRLDFDGPSGRTYSNLTASSSKSATFTSANGSSFSQFIWLGGSDKIDLVLDARGDSTVTAGSNVASSITSSARANLSVTYNYTINEAVPEPGIIGGAILGFGFIRTARSRALANGKKDKQGK